jgi:hypothetical protein
MGLTGKSAAARGDILNAEVGKHFGLGFFDGQQVVAGRAILRDAGAVFGRVVAVVAAEAAGILLVADVVGMRSPGDFHERETHSGCRARYQFLSGMLHQRGFFGEDLGMLAAIEGLKLLGNLDAASSWLV